jgi:hypothetical protein
MADSIRAFSASSLIPEDLAGAGAADLAGGGGSGAAIEERLGRAAGTE